MTRIVVLVDGIRTRDLIAAVGRLVQLEDVELVLVYVRGHGGRAGLEMLRRRPGRGSMPPGREHDIMEAERSRGGDALAEAGRIAQAAGARARTVEVAGDPGREVCTVAMREHADLIVVRAHASDQPPAGRGPLGRAARFIADHAPCSVLLVAEAL